MRNTKTFTADENRKIAALIQSLLAETAQDPLDVPTKKTPFIERAKALGFGHRQGIAIANKAIAQFARRAQRMQAKLDRLVEKKRKYEALLGATLREIVAGQRQLVQPVPRDELKAVLAKAGLRTSPQELRRAAEGLLRLQVRAAYMARHRTCVNGAVRVVLDAAAPAGVAQREVTDWDLYRGCFKGWAADITHTWLTVHPDYWKRVSARGLVTVDGKLVLDAVPVRRRAADGVSLFAVSWVDQPRRNANFAQTAMGYVAVKGDVTALGTTAQEAVSKVRAGLAKAA